MNNRRPTRGNQGYPQQPPRPGGNPRYINQPQMRAQHRFQQQNQQRNPYPQGGGTLYQNVYQNLANYQQRPGAPIPPQIAHPIAQVHHQQGHSSINRMQVTQQQSAHTSQPLRQSNVRSYTNPQSVHSSGHRMQATQQQSAHTSQPLRQSNVRSYTNPQSVHSRSHQMQVTQHQWPHTSQPSRQSNVGFVTNPQSAHSSGIQRRATQQQWVQTSQSQSHRSHPSGRPQRNRGQNVICVSERAYAYGRLDDHIHRKKLIRIRRDFDNKPHYTPGLTYYDDCDSYLCGGVPLSYDYVVSLYKRSYQNLPFLDFVRQTREKSIQWNSFTETFSFKRKNHRNETLEW